MKNIVSVQQAETCSSEHSESKSSGLSGRNLLVLCFGWDVKTKDDVGGWMIDVHVEVLMYD